jgi:hypothetical protein
MPVLKYIGWVGVSLVVFLFVADWFLPKRVRESHGDTIRRPVIRITSLQPPPERIFIDTSVPTIVPPPMLFEDTAPSPTSQPLQSHASPGALALIERETPPRTIKDNSERPGPSKHDVSESRGTLTEADRRDIPHLQHEAQAERISSVNRRAPPNLAPIIAASNAVAQHTRGAPNKTADVEKPKLGPQHRKRKAAKTDGSKAVVQVKSCLPNAFAGMLKALNISRGCET